MHLKSIRSAGPIKRFDSVQISGLPATARIIFLLGPNGCGKSSIFDALLLWHHEHGRRAGGWDDQFYLPPGRARAGGIDVEFHEELPGDTRLVKALFHYRSAYRYTSQFQVGSLGALPALEDSKDVNRSIDEDRGVAQHYARLWGNLVELAGDRTQTPDLERIHRQVIDPIAASFNRLFPDLRLENIGHPFSGRGTFYFSKGSVSGFPYVNLSAGEKAAFDLLLDAHLRGSEFPDSIFLLDEPESHLNTRIQAAILDEMLKLGPARGQLIVATHSLAMMRRGVQLARDKPEEIAFVNFDDIADSFNPRLEPAKPTRHLWQSIHRTSLDDLADLVSPDIVYLVEGSIDVATSADKQAFDARVLSKIFSDDFPEVEFQSIGNSGQVKRIGAALQNSTAIRSQVRRVVDRDSKTDDEIAALRADGTIVWTQRELENYLLDDEVLEKLCQKFEPDIERRSESLRVILAIRDGYQTTGVAVDDYKARLKLVFRAAKSGLPNMTQPGSTEYEFLVSTLAPLITKDTAQYARLAKELQLI
ncbi:AAA family ATPase [Dactylosporangium sp. NPDC049525]|uniref:AAA family ATPase n=1 Tax=Dactylosporangium sp. NPDC049525 TaxID=3154730 RepID=UPI0034436C46